MKRSLLATACIATAFFSGAESATAQARTEVGTLICSMAPTIGAMIGSRRRMTCHFQSNASQGAQSYSGTITRFGVDVGGVAGGIMSWRVLSRTRAVSASAIAGHYFGVSADASMGIGAGAKVLIGGSRRATMLQPVAWVGNIGINLAVGITGLTLRQTR